MASQENGSGHADFVPVRHPRPLTVAELHLALEKEQEAVVNRLTRELTLLRAQNSASVASTTSNASMSSNPAITNHAAPSLLDTTDPHPSSIIGPSYPSTARRHGSSSSLSASTSASASTSTRTSRSNTLATGTTGVTTTPAPSSLPAVGGTSQASFDRARDAIGARSRQNSTVLLPSPSPSHPNMSDSGVGLGGGPGTYFPQRQHSMSSMSSQQQSYAPARSSSTSTSTSITLRRWEEAAQARAQLDAAKGENDALISKVKDLEKAVRGLNSASR